MPPAGPACSAESAPFTVSSTRAKSGALPEIAAYAHPFTSVHSETAGASVRQSVPPKRLRSCGPHVSRRSADRRTEVLSE